MKCKKCGTDLPDAAAFCYSCGRKQIRDSKKKRGNGQGSVYKRGDKWTAIITTGYEKAEDGRPRKRHTVSKTCATKREAVEALAELRDAQTGKSEKPKTEITFKELYDLWFPTHKAGKSTIGCYTAAIKHFRPVWDIAMQDIDIDDLQDCLDECGKGKRTQQNMKTMCGLVFKYGIPRNMVLHDRDLSKFLIVGDGESVSSEAFTEAEIAAIKKRIGKTPYADYVYCMIYLGFRPSEFLNLQVEKYNAEKKYFVGGSKTEAGIDRMITVSPKIQKYVDAAIGSREDGFVFTEDGRHFARDHFTDVFYRVLDEAGIDNPVIDHGYYKKHRITPHGCRRTFATLMKRVEAPSKDKQMLIGHSSEAMLKHYQDVSLEDLRKITSQI